MRDNDAPTSFETFLSLAEPPLRATCEALRRAIHSVDNRAVQRIWPRLRIASYGIGPSKLTEHYAYIAIHAMHVNLGFYHGIALRDPHNLLAGDGKRLRHVQVRSVALAGSDAIADLLHAAVGERRAFRGSQQSRGPAADQSRGGAR